MKAIVFTLDALLAIPLLITIVGGLVAFTATFRENILPHEYTYVAARDTMVRLAELKVEEYEALGAAEERELTIAELIGKRILEGKRTEARAIFERFFEYPYGYIFEFLNTTTGEWEVVAEREMEGSRFEAPYSHLVTTREAPRIVPLGDCPSAVACPLLPPADRYSPGKIVGPIMLRLRVRA